MKSMIKVKIKSILMIMTNIIMIVIIIESLLVAIGITYNSISSVKNKRKIKRLTNECVDEQMCVCTNKRNENCLQNLLEMR